MYRPVGSTLSMNSIVFSYLKSVSTSGSAEKLNHLHGEDDATTKDQPAQTWNGTRPESQEAFVPEDFGYTIEAVLVHASCFYRLHAGLDSVNWHGSVDGDYTGKTSEPKSAYGSKLLARRNVRLSKLLERCVTREAYRRVGSLSRGSRKKALEEASDTLLLGD